MSEFDKLSTDGGATFMDVEDSKAVHWGDQSKGYVGKNVLPYPYTISGSVSGITCTDNGNGTLTLNGTTGAAGGINLISQKKIFKKTGDYIVTSPNMPSNDFSLTLKNRTRNISYILDKARPSQAVPVTDLNDTWDFYLWFNSASVSVNNFTLYPMIRLASVSDSTYEPWLPDNTELVTWEANAVTGVHNFCKVYGTFPKESSGVTATKNADDSITFSGSATAYASFYMLQLDIPDLKKSYFVGGLSGTTNMAWGNTYVYNASGVELANIASPNNSNDRVMDFSAYPTASYVRFEVKRLNNGAVSGTLYPLIKFADDTDSSYQPYAMTNRELTEISVFNKLTSADDLDDYASDGKYWYETSLPANAPDTGNVTWAKVFVIGEGTPLQLVISASAMYTRRKGGAQNTWGNWFKFTGTQI